MPEAADNLTALYRELDWLDASLEQTLARYLLQDGHAALGGPPEPPPQPAQGSVYGRLIDDWQLAPDERLAVALALAPHLRPELLDRLFGVNGQTGRTFSEFGGALERGFSGFAADRADAGVPAQRQRAATPPGGLAHPGAAAPLRRRTVAGAATRR
jgi:hypothetical protein